MTGQRTERDRSGLARPAKPLRFRPDERVVYAERERRRADDDPRPHALARGAEDLVEEWALVVSERRERAQEVGQFTAVIRNPGLVTTTQEDTLQIA